MERVQMMDCGDGIRRADNGSWGKGPIAKTADYQIKVSETGTVFSNAGAAGAVKFTLPTPKKGLRFMFLKAADQNLLIYAPAGSTVSVVFGNPPNGAISNPGKGIADAANGDAGAAMAQIYCDGTNYWSQTVGGWDVSNT